MKTLLIIIAVSNSRFYHEMPIYAINFSTEQQCQQEAAKYPHEGTFYNKAVCVPLIEKK